MRSIPDNPGINQGIGLLIQVKGEEDKVKRFRKSVGCGLMVAIVLFAAGVLSTASGQMPIASEDPNRLQFTISPYGWLTGITGNVTAKGISTSPNVSFSDILSDLDFAYSGHMELQKDRWSIYLDPCMPN
jgi:hypothetical protein